MDTLTHALLGSLVVRATTPAKGRFGGVDSRTSILVGGLAAAFPDIDYLSFWIAPLTFLAEWHRGPTHSLVLAPIWALLLGILFAFLFRNRANWKHFVGICLLALLSHIGSDLITAYGTQILSPISDIRVAFATTFPIDPYFSALVIGGLTASLLLPYPRASARLGLLALAGYLGFQLFLQQQAISLGEKFVKTEGVEQSTIHALPQPLSPFNWLILVSDGQQHHMALVNLAYIEGSLPLANKLGWLGELWSAYQPPNALTWKTHSLYGDVDNQRDFVKEVWQLAPFVEFRRFARFPVLYRIDQIEGESCVWYTDLRYVLPHLTPPFRYGMCGRGSTDTWTLYRLRRFTRDERHHLG